MIPSKRLGNRIVKYLRVTLQTSGRFGVGFFCTTDGPGWVLLARSFRVTTGS